MGNSPNAQSARATSGSSGSGSSAAQADLIRLRTLLLGQDYERLLDLQKDYQRLIALKEELTDSARQTDWVAKVLSEAVLLREHQDQGVSMALRPAIADSIKASVRKDPQPLIDAIFPVIGPAIRRSVNEAIAGMLQVFDQLLEHNLSLRAVKWRFEAWRTGRTYAEVVMLRTLIYWVDQVFLIHRETGLLLKHVAAQNAVVKDPNLVGSMLSAIKDFMSDSFTLPHGLPVQSLQVGDCNVMLEEGRLAVIAAVVRGNPPSDLSRTLRETLDTIQLLCRAELDRFDGDTAVFEGTGEYLEDCLASQPQQGARKKPWRALFLLMVLLGGPMVYWGYQTYQHRQQERLQRETWNAAVEDLRQEPGLVVISAESDDGIGWVQGLRDPLARDPMAVIGPEARRRLHWDWQWRPYLSMEPEFLLARAKQALQPPASVGLTLDGTSLQLTGQAFQEWIDNMRKAAPRIAGISGYRDDGLVAAEQALERYRQVIESTVLYFGIKKYTLGESEIRRVKALVPTIQLLQEGAEDLGLTVTIQVEGHADQSGSEAQNRRLSKLRADSVTQALVDQGLEPSLFSSVGMGSRSPVEAGPAGGDRGVNRRVSLKALLQGPNHEAELVRP